MANRFHYLALGSNVRSREYVPAMIDHWAAIFGRVYLGPLFRTQPKGVRLDAGWPDVADIEPYFVNGCFAVEAPDQWIDAQWCRSFAKVLEVALDRPLDLPSRREVSRTIDIDYICSDQDHFSQVLTDMAPYSCMGLTQLIEYTQPALPGASLSQAEAECMLADHIEKKDFKYAERIQFLW